jgi:hypothetical protein
MLGMVVSLFGANLCLGAGWECQHATRTDSGWKIAKDGARVKVYNHVHQRTKTPAVMVISDEEGTILVRRGAEITADSIDTIFQLNGEKVAKNKRYTIGLNSTDTKDQQINQQNKQQNQQEQQQAQQQLKVTKYDSVSLVVNGNQDIEKLNEDTLRAGRLIFYEGEKAVKSFDLQCEYYLKVPTVVARTVQQQQQHK